MYPHVDSVIDLIRTVHLSRLTIRRSLNLKHSWLHLLSRTTAVSPALESVVGLASLMSLRRPHSVGTVLGNRLGSNGSPLLLGSGRAVEGERALAGHSCRCCRVVEAVDRRSLSRALGSFSRLHHVHKPRCVSRRNSSLGLTVGAESGKSDISSATIDGWMLNGCSLHGIARVGKGHESKSSRSRPGPVLVVDHRGFKDVTEAGEIVVHSTGVSLPCQGSDENFREGGVDSGGNSISDRGIWLVLQDPCFSGSLLNQVRSSFFLAGTCLGLCLI